jgi:hypothetical protein
MLLTGGCLKVRDGPSRNADAFPPFTETKISLDDPFFIVEEN